MILATKSWVNELIGKIGTPKDGKDGVDGVDGKDGKDGRNGIDGATGADGQDGQRGADGRDGIDTVQCGRIDIGGVDKGWFYKDIVFAQPFPPGSRVAVMLSVGEISGGESVGKYTLDYFGYESVTNTGFRLALHESSGSGDISFSYMAAVCN